MLTFKRINSTRKTYCERNKMAIHHLKTSEYNCNKCII